MRSDFVSRHIGPSSSDIERMLGLFSAGDLDEFIKQTAPSDILSKSELDIGEGLSEDKFLNVAREIANKNRTFKNYIGLGYYGTKTPTVVLRNVLENPAWYTAYTPYQAEISQGRMEALLNYQTLISDLTGLEISNASLLDEGTAAAEAMAMCFNFQRRNIKNKFYVGSQVFPQTLEVLQTRAKPVGIEIITGDFKDCPSDEVFAALVQYPDANGDVKDFGNLSDELHKNGAQLVVAADLLSLTMLKTPADFGADVAVGSTQRFGVPIGFGGPHAAYFATKKEFQRMVPGRIIGVSKDSQGNPAMRLALQTREQHIRREKATSNICTSQVLLAVMASMYAVYHGPDGLKHIATQIHRLTATLKRELLKLGIAVQTENHFDTLSIDCGNENERNKLLNHFLKLEMNLGKYDGNRLLISLDETCDIQDVENIVDAFKAYKASDEKFNDKLENVTVDGRFLRKSDYLTHPTFNSYQSETEMLRYITRLASKDLTLANAMIPLGSCTMKLNATTEMIPVTWPEFGNIHPFASKDQSEGYLELINQLERWLCDITGFSALTFQPNAGSQGEYAGLLVIKKYHEDRNEPGRNICLIPSSAHGTNPASAVMAGFKVVVVKCDDAGNIDLLDLQDKIHANKDQLGALMVTYPSTHGVFEEDIRQICTWVHEAGGQVYMDGANLNALVGISRPGEFGPDVSHLNLHKTFCIPHGGGGPGVGPIGVAEHLKDYLPGKAKGISAVSAAPYGSASILPISWAYIALMGGPGLKKATMVAILSANYIAKRLEKHYPVLYTGKNGLVAHECILDTRPFKASAGITVDDIAKRLIDYGFHAPTMSWPVAGTLMIEPTESESLEELDRFCDAMIEIRNEIAEIEKGEFTQEDNVLKNAPHSIHKSTATEWTHKYSREKACFPLAWVKQHKFWPTVGRVDNAFGDRNLVCSCPDTNSYQ